MPIHESPRCPECGKSLQPSKFKAAKYKRASSEIQFRCTSGCGRAYKVQKRKLVLDPVWCSHEYLFSILFKNREPSQREIDLVYQLKFPYMPRKNFNRSAERARAKREEIAKATENTEHNRLFE